MLRYIHRIALVAFLLITTTAFSVCAQHKDIPKPNTVKTKWIDSIYNRLTIEERIGQLFMIPAYSGGRLYNEEKVLQLLRDHQVGGLIFMQGNPDKQALLNNQYQRLAQVPLLVSMDAEWGLGMRLDSVMNFPRQMMLGATRDTALAYKMGMAIAYQCKRLGVHIDFAPVVDVNNNADNPVINSRSFGEDKIWVTKLGIAYMRGLQDNGVMACAKHFPGHGDVSVDSHKDLPFISRSLAQLDTVELYPFKKMMDAGIQSMMIAHLEIPALEREPHVPTTLSKNTVTGLLKNKMGFKGLVFTDALDMKGVTKYYQPGDVDLRAFMAGNDVLLFSEDVPVAVKRIKSALDSGTVTEKELENSVKKILAAKYDAGLANWQPVSTYNLTADLNKYVIPIREQIAAAGITVVRDDNGVLNKLNTNIKLGYIGINASEKTPLYEILRSHLSLITPEWFPKGSSTEFVSATIDKMAKNDATIVAIHNLSFNPANNYGLDASAISFLQQVQRMNNVIIVLQGNAYAMQNFCEARSLILGYDDDSVTERVMSSILLKKIKAKGRLPVTPCFKYPPIVANATPVLPPGSKPLNKVILPQEAGVIDPAALDKLNLFIDRCIFDKAFPGCRIVAARNGNIFYDQSFGYYTYNKDKRVDTGTLYDVASVTKVLTTTLAVMRLYENGKISLDKTLGDYLPITKGTDKARLKIRDVLLHQAGLKSWIPFYKETLDEHGDLRKELFRQTPDNDFSIQVAKDLYLLNSYRDTIWSRILTSPLENKGRFVYSDLDFYFLAAIVQQITGQSIDKYAMEQFYKPMGLSHITYQPLKQFKESDIAPTEDDKAFRHELLQGYVHDQGAALLGGVAGHAGIFATAGDVAAIFQMLLNKGQYKGRQYFKKTTVEFFTAYNTALSRRGLGFDKPAPDKDNAGPAGDRTTGLAFGHQGFTGTCAWADPATGVVFVFLSNRVYPSADNNKINHLDVRTLAQDYIYESLGYPVNHNRPEIYKKQIQ